MTHKKKSILISISICLVIIIASVFIALSFTVWESGNKSSQETTQPENPNPEQPNPEEPTIEEPEPDKLKDFNSVFKIQKDDSEQKTERSIVVTEDGVEVAKYYQVVEIRNQNNKNVAHLSVAEEFPTLETTEFDTYDEYYLIDGIMFMQRVSAGETSSTSFGSTIDVFWDVVSEYLGPASYNFAESYFTNLQLLHDGNIHKMSGLISDEHKSSFFEGAEILSDMSEISIAMTYEESGYFDLQIEYEYQQKQHVTIRIIKSQPTEIEIKDFVQR